METKMDKMTLEKALAFGGNEWKSQDGTKHRVYFNDEKARMALSGITGSRGCYKDAEGSSLSNNQVFNLTSLPSYKPHYDVKNDKLVDVFVIKSGRLFKTADPADLAEPPVKSKVDKNGYDEIARKLLSQGLTEWRSGAARRIYLKGSRRYYDVAAQEYN
jgi:hypothetical protein